MMFEMIALTTHLEKYVQVKMGSSSPIFGVKIKNIETTT